MLLSKEEYVCLCVEASRSHFYMKCPQILQTASFWHREGFRVLSDPLFYIYAQTNSTDTSALPISPVPTSPRYHASVWLQQQLVLIAPWSVSWARN